MRAAWAAGGSHENHEAGFQRFALGPALGRGQYIIKVSAARLSTDPLHTNPATAVTL